MTERRNTTTGQRGPATTPAGSRADERTVAQSNADEALPVLFVVYQTGNRANGGVESITQVIEHMQNVRPLVLTQREMPVNERWRAAGAQVEVWPFLDDGNNAGRAPEEQHAGLLEQAGALVRANAAVYRYVRERGVRVVHCNGRVALWHAGWGARAAGAQLAFNVRDVRRPSNTYGWKWRAAHLSNRVVCLSGEMKATLERRLPGLPPFKTAPPAIDDIYSIVDFAEMHPAEAPERRALREELGLPASRTTFAYVATINDKKNQLEFIKEAGPLLKRRLPGATVHFVGDFEPEENSYARRCRRAVSERGLEDVFTFAGYTDRVADWYRAADVTLLASRREGMARCMIESLACETPVVSFDVCSAREILERHDCGIVVEQGDYTAFVEAACSLARDSQERRQLGANGHRAARKLFAPEEMSAQYEALYRELAEQRS